MVWLGIPFFKPAMIQFLAKFSSYIIFDGGGGGVGRGDGVGGGVDVVASVGMGLSCGATGDNSGVVE